MTYSIDIDVGYSQVVHDFNKLARRFEDSGDLFISYADESKRVQKRDSEQVVTVYLGSANFVPCRRAQRVVLVHLSVYPGGLIDAGAMIS